MADDEVYELAGEPLFQENPFGKSGFQEGVDENGTIRYVSKLDDDADMELLIDGWGIGIRTVIEADPATGTPLEGGDVLSFAMLQLQGTCSEGHEHTFVGAIPTPFIDGMLELMAGRIAHFKEHGE